MSDKKDEGKKDDKAARPTHQVQKWDSLKTQATAPFGVNGKALTDCMFIPKQERENLLTKVGGIDGIAQALLSDVHKGINDTDTAQMEQRKTVFGINRLPPAKVKSFLAMFFEAAKDKIMILLTVAAIISIVLGMIFHDKETGWVEGTAIIVAVFIVILITSFNNWSKERKFRALNDVKNDQTVTAFRNGVKKEVSVYDVVVGDVLMIRTGSKLCADGVLIEGFDMAMNESTATGESKEVRKGVTGDGADRFFYSGTDCVLGEGHMMVTGVGESSFGGMTTMALRRGKEEQPPTPLQTQLGHLAERIGKIGMAVAVGLFIILILLYVIKKAAIQKEKIQGGEIGQEIIKFAITSLAIIVVAVPEGLPLAVTIALAFSMTRMMKDNNLVRNLDACETMGGATAVCTDKTGTLTQNKMTVVRAWIGEVELRNISAIQEFTGLMTPAMKELTAEGICANSSAEEQPTESGGKEWMGSKTEVALLQFVEPLGIKYTDIRAKQNIMKRWPFASARKRMSTALATNDPQKQRIHMKGASEIVLELCTHMRAKDGSVVALKEEYRNMCKKFIGDMASHALRTICLAYCDISTGSAKSLASIQHKLDEPEGDMTLIGLFGIEDPLRPEAAQAVLDCYRAGITVRMVTGDNIETARSIAHQCHILKDEDMNKPDASIEGPVFRALERSVLMKTVISLRVMARSSPLDKQILVEALQELNEVVAVTGDGTNDGPALARANVGFAMMCGTDVAKEASAIILMDDNFASIVKAVMWGRNVFDSIRKFLQLQITINIVAVTVAFVGAITGSGDSPLTAIQLLWVNLVMDAFAALALATDTPVPEMLDRKPYGKHPALISRIMWKHILGMAGYQLIVIFVVLYGGPNISGGYIENESRVHYTFIFNLFIWLQLFNEFNCRRIYDERNIFNRIVGNRLFLIIFVGTAFVQAIITEFGGNFISTTHLPWSIWLICIGLGVTTWLVRFLLSFIPIKEKVVVEPVAQKEERLLDTESRKEDPSTFSMRSVGGEGAYKIVKPGANGGEELVVPQPAVRSFRSFGRDTDINKVVRERDELAAQLQRIQRELDSLKGVRSPDEMGPPPMKPRDERGPSRNDRKSGAGERGRDNERRDEREYSGDYSYYSDDEDYNRGESPRKKRSDKGAKSPTGRGGGGGGRRDVESPRSGDYSYYTD